MPDTDVRLERYRVALEFYAALETWPKEWLSNYVNNKFKGASPAARDCGVRARAALSKPVVKDSLTTEAPHD